MKMTPELSKRVGWEKHDVPWPTLQEVKAGTDEQILTWHRFLPSATTVAQSGIQNAVYHQFTGV